MARDKEKKIAGVTYDKWIEKAEKERAPIRDLRKYSNKLIAYLDVLGIKSLIEKHRNDDEHIAIDKIEKIRKIVEDSADKVRKSADIDYLHISDSFVFVCDPRTIILLIELLSTIQMRIISECQFLLRGAITIGDAIAREDSKFIVGPAYIQAYQLQENDAIYPRIIADKSVINEIKRSGQAITAFLQQDSDRESFIDYIKVYMKKQSLSKQQLRVQLRREDIFTYLTKSFNENYRQENHNISQKYGWTIQYYKKLEVWEDG